MDSNDFKNWSKLTLIIVTDAVNTEEQKLRVQKCIHVMHHFHSDMRWKRRAETIHFQKILRKRMWFLVKDAFKNGFLTESYHIMHYFSKLNFKSAYCAFRHASGACCGRRSKSSIFCAKHYVYRLRLRSAIDELQVKYNLFPEFKSLLMNYLGYEAVRLKHSDVLRRSGIYAVDGPPGCRSSTSKTL